MAAPGATPGRDPSAARRERGRSDRRPRSASPRRRVPVAMTSRSRTSSIALVGSVGFIAWRPQSAPVASRTGVGGVPGFGRRTVTTRTAPIVAPTSDSREVLDRVRIGQLKAGLAAPPRAGTRRPPRDVDGRLRPRPRGQTSASGARSSGRGRGRTRPPGTSSREVREGSKPEVANQPKTFARGIDRNGMTRAMSASTDKVAVARGACQTSGMASVAVATGRPEDPSPCLRNATSRGGQGDSARTT